MPQFHVQYARRANQDVAKILEWLQARSAQGAARWLDALDEANNRLSESPLSFGLAEEADFFPELVRQILIRTRHGSTYRALFVVREATVKVLCVRGPGQALVTPEELKL